ncbi:hypothetical protein DL762_000285 [Monosporascus cannonballus]|uniref:Helicase ATP-binding domain-containing protein n=1 Tax=Monosporascus cannonballus TaxID=155416 RepID=A0ABY0HKD6_9PEZI|nr:hypothetical protein DL762_000285 [Monosporascus cannonballus]
MWYGRLLMLEHIFEGQPDDPYEMDVDIIERFKDEYREWLADGSNIPFSTMIRWMSYGKGHRRKEGGAARIMWEEGVNNNIPFLPYEYDEKGAVAEKEIRKRQAAETASGNGCDGENISDDYGGGRKRIKTAGGPDNGDDGDGGDEGRIGIESGLRRLGTTVVMVPFVALMDDLVERAKTFGVDCIRWQPAVRTGRDEPLREARLVVVSADLAGCDEFMAYADGLRARGLLRRIFIDECYTIIMDAGYRKKLTALKGLYRFDCPVVLLTATLPVRLERWFRQEMVAGDADIVRAATVKRNIRYRAITVEPSKTAVEDEVVRTVLRMEKGMRDEQKGVVYCRTKKKCEALAERLGCDFYHSGITDEGKRQQALRQWAEGKVVSWSAGMRGRRASTGAGGLEDVGLGRKGISRPCPPVKSPTAACTADVAHGRPASPNRPETGGCSVASCEGGSKEQKS